MRVPSTVVPYLVSLLLICAAIEFTFMRVLLRSGPALNAEGHARTIADTVVLVGHTAMNLGVVIGVLVLGLLGWRLITTGSLLYRMSGIAAGMLAATIIWVLSGRGFSPGGLIVSAGMSIVVIVLAIAAARPNGREAAALVLIAGAYVALFGHYIMLAAGSIGTVQLPSLAAFYAAEALVVLAGAGTLLLVRGWWSWKRVIAGIAVAGGFFAAHSALPWLTSTIGIWNFGVTMSLPPVVYGAALACCVTAILHLWRNDRIAASALILMVLGGMKLDVVYFHLLGVTGVLLLAICVSERQFQTRLIEEQAAKRSAVNQPLAAGPVSIVDG